MKLIYKLEPLWEFIRYGIPNFFRNIWIFRKFLLDYHWWDYHFILQGLSTSLKPMADNLEKKGIEIESSRMKKVQKIRRAIEILDNITEDNYTSMAEKELGEIIYNPIEFIPIQGTDKYSLHIKDTEEESSHNSSVYKRSNEIQESEWNELFQILKGQDGSEYISHRVSSGTNENCDESGVEWDSWFDGTGLRGWWD